MIAADKMGIYIATVGLVCLDIVWSRHACTKHVLMLVLQWITG